MFFVEFVLVFVFVVFGIDWWWVYVVGEWWCVVGWFGGGWGDFGYGRWRWGGIGYVFDWGIVLELVMLVFGVVYGLFVNFDCVVRYDVVGGVGGVSDDYFDVR